MIPVVGDKFIDVLERDAKGFLIARDSIGKNIFWQVCVLFSFYFQSIPYFVVALLIVVCFYFLAVAFHQRGGGSIFAAV
ncbi:hypothetical protein J2S36_001463 [Arcanobacterium hippocoleae]|uniref:Uncharacterized protein n=1 Tax=Arcanobacterium hippocoleae TaxID=149017 RepID=A0ABU1T3W8_9ACTO|nr:hypothetical protein [Arcanobacterium hippocoleae]